MIKKLGSYHDSFFQSMMEKLEVAKSFFQAHMAEELVQALDWKTLQIADAVRRAPDRKPLYTDITYHVLTKASKANVFLHVEQERGIDKGIVERIWQYNARLLSKHREQGHDKLPIIISFVLYNGTKDNYPYHEDICEYFEDPNLARLVIDKPFKLINLNQQSDEALVTHGPSGIMEVLLKRASQANFTKWLQEHKELMRKLPADAYLNAGIDYALGVGQEKAEQIIHSFILVYPKLKETIMTAARQLQREGEKIGRQKGRQEGLQEGLQKGLQEGRQHRDLEIAQSMLKKGLAPNLIQELTGLSLEQLKKLHKS